MIRIIPDLKTFDQSPDCVLDYLRGFKECDSIIVATKDNIFLEQVTNPQEQIIGVFTEEDAVKVTLKSNSTIEGILDIIGKGEIYVSQDDEDGIWISWADIQNINYQE